MVTVGPLEASDKNEWQRLYKEYAVFYRMPMPAETLDLVWQWLHDEAHELNALVAREAQSLVGLAHYHAFARPLAGTTGLFLDDLFVDAAARRGGIGDALLNAIADEARGRGIPVVRWITADDNYAARSLYDRAAKRTSWITYDMDTGDMDTGELA